MAEIGLVPFAGVAREVAQRFCLPTVAVSANINAPSRSCWHSLPDALPRLDFRQAESVWPSLATGEKLCICAVGPTTRRCIAFCSGSTRTRSRAGWEKGAPLAPRQDPGAAFPVPSMAQEYLHTRSARTFSAVASNKMAEKSAFGLWQWLIVVDGKQQICWHNERGKDPGSTRGLAG